MIAIVMDLYSSFAGLVEFITSPGEIIVDDYLLGEHPWLKLMIEPVFLYGSLPRPPDLQSSMVCVWIMHSISHQLSSGTVYCCVPHEPCIDSENSFRHPNLSRQGEIWLDILMQNHQHVIAPRCLELNGVGVISEIVPTLCCVDEFIHLVYMVREAVPKMLVSRGLRVIDTDDYGLYATNVASCSNCVLLGQTFARCSTVHRYPLGYTPKQGEFLSSHIICKLLNSSTKDTKLRKFGLVGWNHVSTLLALNLKLSPDIGDLQLDVSSYHLFDVVCSSLDATEYTSMANVVSALHIVNNLVFLVLLQQSFHPVSLQRWSQDYDLIRQTIVAHFGWFGFILEFLYGSLQRPPDILSVFSPKSYNFHGVFKSKMQVTSILRGSIRVYIAGLVMV